MLDRAVIDDYQALIGGLLSQGAPMNAAQVQGLCAAVAVAPVFIRPSAWLSRVWDATGSDHPPAFEDGDEFQHALDLVQRIYNDTVASLGPARNLNLRLHYHHRTDCNVHDFCRGFVVGLELAPESWAELKRQRPQWFAAFEQLARGEPLRTGDNTLADDTVLVLLLRLADHSHGQGKQAELVFSPDTPAQAVWPLIKPELDEIQPSFPFAAVELADRHRELVTPHLVAALNEVLAGPQAFADDFYMLHQYAAALLGQWRDTRGFAPLLAMAQVDEATLEALWGESINTIYVRAVAGTCPGDVQPLRELALDAALTKSMRLAMMRAWKIRVVQGDADLAAWQDTALAICQERALALRPTLPRQPYSGDLIDSLVSDAGDLGATAFIDSARAWYGEGLMDPKFSSLQDVERDLARTESERRRDADLGQDHYIRSAAGEIAWWACYFDDEQGPYDEPLNQPYVRPTPKVGRNDPCPCGSGRKYKKCHGAT